jgi:glycosyltransferase involved in cell wall biosynthesis
MEGDTTSGLARVAEVPWSADIGACGEACNGPHEQPSASPATARRVALLTGGRDRPYALGLASALLSCGVAVDFVGDDTAGGRELRGHPRVRFVRLRDGSPPDAGLAGKIWSVLLSYVRLLRYAASSEAPVFHVLWNTRLETLDRTLVLLYYRLLGKRIAFTVHNVNVRRRDGGDTAVNRLTLRVQYRLVHHLFVHSDRMKRELQTDFAVPEGKITVIPFGINGTVPNSALTSAQAKERVGLSGHHKVMLFFGNIAPYKGLEYLVDAVAHLVEAHPECRLIVAGRPKGSAAYWQRVARRICGAELRSHVIERIEYVPDRDTEIYFKAADVLVLPYTHVDQSGVLFLGYNFGLPVIASDVGSLEEEIIEGTTGFVCRPRDASDLAKSLESYFASDLYRNLEMRRPGIRKAAHERHCWRQVGEVTACVYAGLVARA